MSTFVSYDKEELIRLIKIHALKTGNFTLSSGKTANYYLDCRKLTLTGEGANVVAAGIMNLLDRDWPDAVGGMAIGADPITAAIITSAYWRTNRPLRGFIVRKQAKEHGTGQRIEGPVEPGDRAVIVEDVVTTGGSSILAIEYAREFGLLIDRVIAIVDRQQGATGNFARLDVRFDSLVRFDELGLDAVAAG
jgi:orotate phosphoribosyltransferase